MAISITVIDGAGSDTEDDAELEMENIMTRACPPCDAAVCIDHADSSLDMPDTLRNGLRSFRAGYINYGQSGHSLRPIKEAICLFFGHDDVYDPDIDNMLQSAVEKVVDENETVEFLVYQHLGCNERAGVFCCCPEPSPTYRCFSTALISPNDQK